MRSVSEEGVHVAHPLDRKVGEGGEEGEARSSAAAGVVGQTSSDMILTQLLGSRQSHQQRG